MFGYTVPMYSRLSPSGLASYRGYYCETCHQLKANYGLMSTAAVNYDMTFNTIVINSLAGGVRGLRATPSPFCVLRRPGTDSEMFERMASYTVLLTKWELMDDEADGPSLRSRIASAALARAIAKAERGYPEYDEAVGRGFGELRRMEEEGCRDPLLMGRTFGSSLAFALNDISGSDDPALTSLFSDLTAAVYLMDAVDDLERDHADGTYNPLLPEEGFVNKERFVNGNVYSLSGLMNTAIGNLQGSYSRLRGRMAADTDITDNIVYYGIPQSARSVMSSSCAARTSLRSMCDARAERNAGY